MTKTVWSLDIGHYLPEVTNITFQLMHYYADKIGAEFKVITERKFPDWPIAYEKLQLHELGRDYDWNIFIDADTLVHPEMFDPTDHLTKDTVCHNGTDMAGNRWSYDSYFRRDGRHIGSCNWFTIASDWCLDLWHPLDLTLDQALKRIHPTMDERAGVVDRRHLIDDYTLSRNIARFGLKVKSVMEIVKQLNRGPANYLWHIYNVPDIDKVRQINEVMRAWNMMDGKKKEPQPCIAFAKTIPGFMQDAELEWLSREARNHECIAELGSLYGRSTRALAANCIHGHVHAIDNWQGIKDNGYDRTIQEGALKRYGPHALYEKFIENMSGLDNVLPVVSDHATAQIDHTPDMVFIDGSHDYDSVRRDIERWLNLAKPGALLCGHDFIYADGVKRAVQELLPNYRMAPNCDIWYTTVPLSSASEFSSGDQYDRSEETGVRDLQLVSVTPSGDGTA